MQLIARHATDSSKIACASHGAARGGMECMGGAGVTGGGGLVRGRRGTPKGIRYYILRYLSQK